MGATIGLVYPPVNWRESMREFATPLLLALCASPGAAQTTFTDVATAAGIPYVTRVGYTPPFGNTDMQFMFRNMGQGAAVGDYDNDGDLDVYMLGAWGWRNRLYRNDLDLGTATFTDVTSLAGVGDRGPARVAHFVDLDNDGFLDILLVNDSREVVHTQLGAERRSSCRLFRNNGDGTFSDVSERSGFVPYARGYLRCGAAIADYDQDGLPDVYVSNWSFEIATGIPKFSGSNRLYRNLGNFRFEDVTEAVGLDRLRRDSFTSILADFDDNGYPDLYVAVDHTSDEFYLNSGGVFSLATVQAGATHTGNDMGVAVADIDGDDDLDLYLTNITGAECNLGTTQGNVLATNQFSQGGSVSFVDHAFTLGVNDTDWGWGTEFADVDNDGLLDILAVNGFDEFIQEKRDLCPLVDTPSYFFRHDPLGTFTETAAGDFTTQGRDSRALIAFDYDRDGDQDLLVSNVDQQVQLLENDTVGLGHWLTLRLEQKAGLNRFGIGARAYVTIAGETQRRDLVVGKSYLAGTPYELSFGLGSATVIDELRIVWSDGTETTQTNVAADQVLYVLQP